MYDTPPERPPRRIAFDQYEHSPSTGAEEIAVLFHAPNAHAADFAEVSP